MGPVEVPLCPLAVAVVVEPVEVVAEVVALGAELVFEGAPLDSRSAPGVVGSLHVVTDSPSERAVAVTMAVRCSGTRSREIVTVGSDAQLVLRFEPRKTRDPT